jgi:hypothetical protein
MGDLFPPDDVVARFVITLAMHANDLFRSTTWLRVEGVTEAEAQGRRLMVIRYQLAMLHEVERFLTGALRLPAVAEFVATLQGDAPTAPVGIANLVDGLGSWVADMRNITFHYPEMHQAKIDAGQDDVMAALAGVTSIESEIVADESDVPGFPFADVVVAHWMRSDFAAAGTAPVEAITATVDFAMSAVRGFLVRQGEDALLSVED